MFQSKTHKSVKKSSLSLSFIKIIWNPLSRSAKKVVMNLTSFNDIETC